MHMWIFRARTIVGVALIKAGLLAILMISGVRSLSDTAESEFEQRSQATIKAFSALTGEALIASDLAALNALTQEMLTYPGVVYARVCDNHRQVLAQAGQAQALLLTRPHQARLTETTNGVYRIDRDVQVHGQRFGEIEIGLAAPQVQHQQAMAIRFGLGLAALELLLVAVFLQARGACRARQPDEPAATAQASKRMSLHRVAHDVTTRSETRQPIASSQAPTGEPAAGVLDPVRYEQVRAIMGDAMDALLDKVLETLDSELRQIQAAAAEGRIDTVRDLLHRIKNTAGDIGAMRLHALAARIEQDILRENAPMPDIGPLELACTDALATVRQLITARPLPHPPPVHP